MGAGSQIAELERTISALRALVAEKDAALQTIGDRVVPLGGCHIPGHTSPDTCWWSDVLALTEDDMRKRLEDKP